MSAKTIIQILLIAIIAGFIAAATYIFFVQAFSTNYPGQFNALQGAFLGAFFAFIFVRIADGLVKINDRKARARNALIKHQHLFNHYLSSLHDEAFLIDDLLDLIHISKPDDKAPRIWTSRLNHILVDRDLLIDLSNMALINEIMSLNDDLRKINQSNETMNKTYEALSSYCFNHGEDIYTYTAGVKGMKKQCIEVRNFIKATKEEIIRLLAITHMLSKDDTVLGKITKHLVLKESYPKYITDNLAAEISKVKKDIEINAAKSQKKINQSTGK